MTPDEWPPDIVLKSSLESEKEEREIKEIFCVADEINLPDCVLDKFPWHKALRTLL